MRRPVFLLFLAAACSQTPKPPDPHFPAKFLFGTAIAGFQADMGCPTIPAAQCEDPNSDWYQFVTDPRILAQKDSLGVSGDPPSAGPGFYELYPEDLARVKNEAKLNAVRLSIEWSRIFPTSTVGVEGYDALKAIASPEGIAYYHRIFAKMKQLGLTPLVTLNHYTLPTWVSDGVGCHFDFQHCTRRGWLDPSTQTEIAKYAGFVAQEYGGEVDLWATENEPLAVVLAGYLEPSPERTNPPALSYQAKAAKAVTLALIAAHAKMYDAVKAGDKEDADGDGKDSEVGLVYNLGPVVPADPTNDDDVTAAKNIFYLYDQLFLDATIRGDLDEQLDGHPTHHPELAGRMDYLGLNYYTRITVAGWNQETLPDFSPLLTIDPNSTKTNFNETYPRGLYEMVKFASSRYHLPIIITENGASADPAKHGEDQRQFFAEHLQWLKRAIDEGADVRGYFWWTMMDNYEWNHGMGPYRFGLWAVDKTDPAKARTKRPLVDDFARLATTREIPADLAAKYPIGK